MAEKMTHALWLRWGTPEQLRRIAQSIWLWVTSTKLWEATFGSRPVPSAIVLAAAIVLAWVLTAWYLKRSRTRTDADPEVIKARRAAEYYTNKLKPVEIRVQTHDKKKFKKCDPLPDKMVPDGRVRAIVQAACYNRYVRSLVRRELSAARGGAKDKRRASRRAVVNAFEEALYAIPDGGTVWVEYIDKKGRTRDTYRFRYDYDALLKHADEEDMRTCLVLEAQGWRCASCGRDPDDGQSFSLCRDGSETKAFCFDCATKDDIGNSVQEAIEKKHQEKG